MRAQCAPGDRFLYIMGNPLRSGGDYFLQNKLKGTLDRRKQKVGLKINNVQVFQVILRRCYFFTLTYGGVRMQCGVELSIDCMNITPHAVFKIMPVLPSRLIKICPDGQMLHLNNPPARVCSPEYANFFFKSDYYYGRYDHLKKKNKVKIPFLPFF